MPRRIDSTALTLALLLCAALTALQLHAQALPAKPSPAKCVKLVDQPLVLVDQATGVGTATLTLTNQLKTPVAIALTAAFAPTLDSRTRVLFAATPSDAPSNLFQQTVAPRKTIFVTLFVKDDWSDGQQDIEIFNHFGRESLGKVHVQRVPVNMSLEDPKLDLKLVDGETSQIVLINKAAIAYPKLQWRLIKGRSICGQAVDIKPKSTTILSCTPDFRWSPADVANAIKSDGMQDGYRLVLFAPPPDSQAGSAASSSSSQSAPDPTAPIVQLASFSGQASLDYFHPFWRGLIKYGTIFLLLILGGVTSLVLSYLIPNTLRRFDLREQLLSLAVRTSDLSSRINSRLAVIVRLERSRLNELLDTQWALSPDFSDIAALAAAGITQLTLKVSLLEQMDTILGLLEQRQVDGVCPTRVEQIYASLQETNVPLCRAEMTPDDIAIATTAIGSAMKQVNLLKARDDVFGSSLATAAKAIVAELDTLAKTAAWDLIKDVAARPLTELRAVTGDVVPLGDYLDVDYPLNKARLIKRYVGLLASIDPASDAMQRLVAHTPELLTNLQRRSWEGLRSAKLLMREMEDDIYPERVVEAIQSRLGDPESRQVRIDIDPAFVYESAPIDVSLRFYMPALDTCAAREEFTVEWTFDKEHTGEGWTVSHYFLRRKTESRWATTIEPFTVTARVFDRDGNLVGPLPNPSGPAIPAKSSPLTAVERAAKLAAASITEQVEVHPSELWRTGQRTSTEIVKLVAALLVAVVGLVSGAESQIDKLDLFPALLAVFLVGFGADSIKRLLTTGK